MSTLLAVHSSPRSERSHSRGLATGFLNHYKETHPDTTFIERDLGHNPVPLVTEAWVVGAFAPAEYQSAESKAAIAISDELVDEFLAADAYVFSVPMYNLNVPAGFKAYIDQIVRVGRTFSAGADGYKGLVVGKKALFITASGGVFRAGTPFGPYNFQEPYLRAIFGFMGFTDIEFVAGDNQNAGGEEAAAQSRAEAAAQLQELAKTW